LDNKKNIMEELKKNKEKKYTLCSFDDENGDTKSKIVMILEIILLWGYGGIYTMIVVLIIL